MMFLVNLFRRLFTLSFEEDEIVFKIEVKATDQEYNSICRFRVYGYWKFASGFRWNSMGLVTERSGAAGKYNTAKDVELLELVKNEFVKRTADGRLYPSSKMMSVSTDEITMLIDARAAENQRQLELKQAALKPTRNPSEEFLNHYAHRNRAISKRMKV